jgi:adenosyl cobinamide kinase/adenosyl cobinamide phosphate guanylyltransferase
MTGSRCLVLGGARSGKSFWAEQRLASQPVRYLATGYPDGDQEWLERLTGHRERRPDRWETIETLEVAEELGRDDPRPILVDCLTLWLTRRMDLVGAWRTSPTTAADLVEPDIAELVAAVAAARCQVVLVSNEVGSGVVPPTAAGRIFGDALGTLNRRIAEQCEEVVLMVAGIPVPVRTPTDRAGESQP